GELRVVEETRGDEEGRHGPVALQDRVGRFVVVAVSIVERDDHEPAPAPGDRFGQVGGPDHVEVLHQEPDLCVEALWRGAPEPVLERAPGGLADAVVTQPEYAAPGATRPHERAKCAV